MASAPPWDQFWSMRASSVIEQLDDRIRKAREIVQRGNEGLSVQRTSLVDRYVEGSVKVSVRRSFPDEPRPLVTSVKLVEIRDWAEAAQAQRPWWK